MNDVAAAHLEKAWQDLDAGRLLLRADKAGPCINRAYYAIYHAATAALEAAGERAKTHKGTHNLFWLRFVKQGGFPARLGKLTTRAQEMREQADYEAFTIYDTAAASDLLQDAEAFVEAAEALISRLSEEDGT